MRASRKAAILAAALLVAGSLAGYFGGTSTFISERITQTRTDTAAAGTGPTTATPSTATTTAPLRLTERPLVWFTPLPLRLSGGRGSVDFMDLFTKDAPWGKAAARVQVFKLYGEWVVSSTDGELRQVVADLNRRGIAIAFEAGPLTPTATCGIGGEGRVEGFGGPEEGLRIAERIKAAGGTVRLVALDEPFAFGHIYSGPNACKWPAEKIAQEVYDYIQGIKSVSPGVIVGDIEPLWAGLDVDELENWLDAYHAVTGTHLPFFHLDVDFAGRPDWTEDAKELENFARERGIEFGIIYTGDWTDTSDGEWVAHAEERMVAYEAQAGGRPDHVIFQSWHDRPDRSLPETDPTAFTHLINRYFRTRTSLSLAVSPRLSDSSRNATGILTDAAGIPVAEASVGLSARPLAGPGLLAEYTLSGTVPVGVTQAVVGFRVNIECGCAGTSDFFLYEVRYVEASEKVNRVPNGDFSRRLEGWGFWGSGSARLERSDRGAGWMLHVIATPSQTAAINSASFPVTPGATYTLTFAARVAPVSVGSGYFDIVFLDPSKEVTRRIIQLEPAYVLIGSTTTDGMGAYRFILKELPPDSLILQAKYPGNDRYWPAYAETVERRGEGLGSQLPLMFVAVISSTLLSISPNSHLSHHVAKAGVVLCLLRFEGSSFLSQNPSHHGASKKDPTT